MIHYGWRSVFYVIGALSLLWSMLYLLVYRNMPEEHQKVSLAELARIRGLNENGEIKKANVQKRPKVPWSILLRHGNMWAVMCAYAAYIYSLWFFLSWLPSYLVEYRKFTLIKMGFFASLPLMAGVVGDTFGGWLTDKLLVKSNNLKFSRARLRLRDARVRCVYAGSRDRGESQYGGLLPGERDVLPRNDDRSGMGRSHGHWRRILGHRFRNDEHGRTNRRGAVAYSLRYSGVQRVLGRSVRCVRGLLFVGAAIWAFWIDPEQSVIDKGEGTTGPASERSLPQRLRAIDRVDSSTAHAYKYSKDRVEGISQNWDNS